MTREEKKQIRLQILKLLDTQCAGCKERHSSTKSTCVISCPIGKQMQQLSVLLSKESSRIKRGKWTEEEEFYLWQHKDILDVSELAARLERSEVSVYSKLRQLEKKNVLPC
ncbi:zinc-finger domain-containing protein [Anoxybacillus sp. ST4]|uniref:zinc-finger domain-containing protein n=1 Tax=Anoxybacillus sp. ST4 TaxID=2864181 RepID=UPI001C642CE7|nr:zinc-finger domain-containing protein [Anoxybacillus sp. ST4]